MISLPVGFAAATGQPNDGIAAEQRGRSPAATQPLPPSAPSLVAQLVQQAEDHYQAGQLADAIARWQQAGDRYEQDGDRLNQALVLSFLATALDDLGQWTQAKDAIGKALSFLNAQNLVANPETTAVLAQVLTTQGERQPVHGQPS